MSVFEKSKWIWPREGAEADEYAEFIEEVSFYGRKADLYVYSARSVTR